MARYIDAERLIEDLQEEIDFETSMYTEEQNKWFNIGLKCACRNVRSQPTADVEKVKHGKWICLEAEIGYFACSECDHRILRAECNYCPNCGAKMDGGE